MDLPNAKNNLKKFKLKYPDLEVLETSVYNMTGINEMLIYLRNELDKIEDQELYDKEELEDYVIYKFDEKDPFTVEKENNIWLLKGEKVEKLLKMTRFDNPDATIRFAHKLAKMGVDEKLEKIGAKPGDEVKILDYIFIFKG